MFVWQKCCKTHLNLFHFLNSLGSYNSSELCNPCKGSGVRPQSPYQKDEGLGGRGPAVLLPFPGGQKGAA